MRKIRQRKTSWTASIWIRSANIYHKLQRTSDIKPEMEKTISVVIPMDPLKFILGRLPQTVTGKDRRYLLGILLLPARKNITLNWRKLSPPVRPQWINKLKQVCTVEYLTAKQNKPRLPGWNLWTRSVRIAGPHMEQNSSPLWSGSFKQGRGKNTAEATLLSI